MNANPQKPWCSIKQTAIEVPLQGDIGYTEGFSDV